ncbi:ABC transporter substrate-binding protein [Paracraurococcus lichenis]|uniref:ABC transporter substrate-binding protein n=1 Tax=Paracraurococcus lichenis TaxID=3064888 RepID=A0ABT9E5M4_9PROT|nr:ABC transporter substrate-binding protein [Paracraurococcus sp. LOR1-02]MDO9711453.1 ABC transporter substrate-binding protein [Paracraurococcus sp. LOR1-02]
MRRRAWLGHGAALAALPWLTAPAVVLAQAAVRGGTLVVNLEPEPSSFLFNAATATILFGSVNDGLVTYDAEFRPVPSLAESWSQSPDGLSITFHLRRGVKWHDGHDFTSADVAYSVLEVVKKVNPRAGAAYSAVVAVDTPDPHTAIFRLSEPSPVIWSILSSAETTILPRHLYEGTNPLINPWNQKFIGTGAFVFREWARGQHILVERNRNYWQGDVVPLDRVRFRVIPDPGARLAALEAGEVHYTPLSVVPPSDVARLRGVPGLTVETRGYGTFVPVFFFDFNLRRPVFQDHRVRAAFAHAIDRQGLADTVWYGLAKPATGPIPSAQAQFHTAETPQYPFDPGRAEALLDAAGLRRGPDGVRLRINHFAMPYGDVLRRAAEYLRESLKRVGVDLQLVNLDVAPFLRRIYADRDFDTYSSYYSASADPQIGVTRRFATAAIQPGVAWSNGTGYSNPEADRIIDASRTEIDPERRRHLLIRLQDLAQRDLPSINLLELQHFSVLSRRVQGLSTAVDGYAKSLSSVWLAR